MYHLGENWTSENTLKVELILKR